MLPISIILPVYNGVRYLEKSVTSVLNQQFSNFEFLVIDDCSTDGSWEYLQSLHDKRITLYRNESNRGLFYNLNFLIKKSHAPIIKIWSQDDVMYPDCLKEVADFHNRYPEISFSYTDRDYIDSEDAIMGIRKPDETPEIVSPALHTKIAFITGSIAGNIANVAINKKVLDEVGLFNESMKISGDFEMWVRLAKNHPVGFIKKPLVQLRNHKGQLSGQEKFYIYHLKEDIKVYSALLAASTLQQRKEGIESLRNQKLLFYYTLMLKAFFKGNFSTGFRFLTTLFRFDNFLLLTWVYFKKRVLFNSKR
jgi:glycosyltransferase involved in cell wall biosynthesis